MSKGKPEPQYHEMTLRDFVGAVEWYASRPLAVQSLIDALPPNSWWVLADDSQPDARYTPIAYSEDGTVRMQRCTTLTRSDDGIRYVAPVWQVFGMTPDQFVSSPDQVQWYDLSVEEQTALENCVGEVIAERRRSKS